MRRVDRTPADTEVRLLGALAEQLQVGLARARSRLGPHEIARGQRAQGLVDRCDRLIRAERTGQRHHRAGGRVAALHEFAQAIRRHREYDLLASGDFPAKRVSGIQQLVEQSVNAVLRLISVHAQLFDDDIAFGVDISRSEHRRPDQVGDDIEGDKVMAGRNT